MRGFIFYLAAAAFCLSVSTYAYGQQDTTLVEELSESVVVGVRAQENAPYAVANITRAELRDFSSTGRELPLLFSRTPGVLGWGENGLGTGTSHLRIRGAGDSRINVTLDGVPLNSPEDQCVFWANMNSYGALLGSAQIQRGVGTSTNVDGAFGGTVSLSTKAPSYNSGAELSMSYGSYNTFNAGITATTGLIRNHLAGEFAYYRTDTDGYMHGSSGSSGSYYAGLSWIGRDYIIRYHNIGNFENTGQAWNGATAGNNDMSLMDGTYGISTGIKTYADMYGRGLGRFNSLYEYLLTDDDGNFVKDAAGNYQTARYKTKDGSLWPRTTDNFWQDHNILSVAGRLGDRLTANGALHYTYGYGYYDEFRPDNKLSKFGIESFTGVDGKVVKRTDFVRRKGLSQNTYGLVGNLNYRMDGLDVIAGVALQQFKGDHFGYLTYIADNELEGKLLSGGRYTYYDSDASKGDYSGFFKAAWHFGGHWDVFGDLQYRHVDYSTGGINDKFYENADGSYSNQRLDVDEHYDFFNPKAGISYTEGGFRAYASVAASHREPERNNFTDNGGYAYPRPEKLLDYELGSQFTGGRFRFSQNFYYMDYTDQFVQTGAVSDIGEALTTNIKDSYRVGVEMSLGWDISPWLTLEGNASFSENRILDFDEVVEDWDDWDTGYATIHYDNSTLAFSPSVILNGFLDFHAGAFSAVWHTGFVDRQYLDNTGNADRSLPAYSVSDISLKYSFRPSRFLREVLVGCNMGNVFNARYAAGGWVYSALYASGGHPEGNRYYQIGFMPMAGFTAMGSLTLRF